MPTRPLGLDSDFVYSDFEKSADNIALPVTLPSGTTFVSTVNGLSGSITISGGTSGYSFTPSGSVLTMSGAAARIKETSGPTTLTIGAIADGEYAKRVGATLVGGTPSAGGTAASLLAWLGL